MEVISEGMIVKNVIILCDVATANGGASKVAIQSAVGLSELGLNVTLFSSVGPVDPLLQKSRVQVVCLGQKDILSEKNRLKAVIQGVWNHRAYSCLRELLDKYDKEDTVVHSHVLIKALSPSLWAVLANYRFKVFVTLHDYFLFCPNGGLYNYKKQEICSICPSSLRCFRTNCDSRSYIHKIWRDIRQLIQRKAFANIQDIRFISISTLNKQLCLPYLGKYTKGWYELHNPIEVNTKDAVDIVNNHAYLFMSRLSPEKGLDLFCEAITQLGLEGIVLGDGELREEYEIRYPNIKFVGWVTGKIKENYIKASKALVFPSKWYEGAPLTIIELKSYGIPCIVPDLCAASEEIEDGKSGLIFKTGNIDSLMNKLVQYESMDIVKLQRNIIDNFDASSYSLRTHCRDLINIYNS